MPRVLYSAYYDHFADAAMFWEIPRIFAAYWDRPSIDTVHV